MQWFLENLFSYILSLYIPFIALLSLLYKRPEKSKKPAKNVIFVIVTIGMHWVRDALFETIQNVLKRFPGYKLYVVTEENADLLDELRNTGVEIVVIPASYKCKKAKYKARAIQYFIENYVQDDYWYVFLDDDSYPLDNNFLYELPEFEKKGYVAGNGILVPRQGDSKLTFLADFIRTTFDKTFYRLTLGVIRRPAVFGMHGELLIVKGKILKEIGFDYNTITEDSRFAVEIFKRKYKTFQTTTKVSIQSPNSVRDFLKQRARWIRGTLHDIPEYPFPTKQLSILMIIVIFTALPGYIMMLYNIYHILLELFAIIKPFINPNPIEHLPEIRDILTSQLTRHPIELLMAKPILLLLNPSMISMFTILLTYLIGARGKYKIISFILAPILMIFEISAPWYSILFYKGGFVVINKNRNKKKRNKH